MLQEIRRMRFEEVYFGWNESRLTQEEAARILDVCDRTFRRYVGRYDEMGLEGLSDKRLTQASFRRAPVDEVMAVAERYAGRYRGWNVKHFYSKYRKDGDCGVTVGSRTRSSQAGWFPRFQNESFIASIGRDLLFQA
jgi:hypothetical protein